MGTLTITKGSSYALNRVFRASLEVRGAPQTGKNRPGVKPGTLTPTGALIGSVGMSNVLNEEKKQQVIALGKLGWPLRRIEQATGVRRETASAYLKSAGVIVCLPGWGRRALSKPANEVTTDLWLRIVS
jgi:hypothetical protein